MRAVIFLLAISFSASLSAAAADQCVSWLHTTFANEWCDELARDTVEQFVNSGQGYLSGMDPCSCDSTALFLTYYFSSVAAMSARSHTLVTNSSFNLWQ